MANIDTSLSEVFGVPTIKETAPPEPAKPVDVPDNYSEDFDFVRQKLYALLSAGTDSFEVLSQLARSEEKVSAFTALNEMLSNLSDISIKLLEIQEKKQKISKGSSPKEQQPQQITNNNVAFIGSTADLARLFDNDPTCTGITIDAE